MSAGLKTFLISTALFSLLPLNASSHINVQNATVFATQSANEPTAIFMDLSNDENQAVNLVVAHSPQAARLELHGMQNGKMLAVSGIEIPARGNMQLKRGGLHIMVFDAERALAAGDKFPLMLMFDNGEKVEVEANVVGR